MRFLAALLLLFPTSAIAQSAGQNVGEATVSVRQVAFQLSGNTSDLQVGDAIRFGGVIETGDESANVDLLADGSKLTVAANSRVEIDKFLFNGGDGDTMRLRLVTGALRLVSGSIASEAIRIDTPVAWLGLRGTRFVLQHSDRDGSVVVVEEGVVEFSNRQNDSVEFAFAWLA